jgi:GH24 family phage-related lysozyme (muramidase)
MAAINPTNNTGLIVDEFISYATNHLNSVQGIISTVSLYTAGPPPSPVQVPGPGIISWQGYFIDPSTRSPIVTEDDFVPKENADEQESVKPTNEETIQNGTTEETIDKELEEFLRGPQIGGLDSGEVVTAFKFNTGKPFVSGFRAGGGGFSGGSGGSGGNIQNVDLGALDLSADWITLAAKFIGKNEGFAKAAINDEGNARLGFGTDKILDPNTGQIRTVQYGDTTTIENALKVLQYEVAETYKKRLVGSGNAKISEADFEALNNKQKAACLSFVYNCGSFTNYPNIPAAIRAKDYAKAATGLLNGPTRGAKTGELYPGLVRRRKEEATLFST